MGPFSRIWDEMEIDYESSTSSMEIKEVNLLEKNLLVIGQVNVASLYKRRLNFLAKTLKSPEKANSVLRETKVKL